MITISTDNIYKLMCIAGIIIFAYATSFPILMNDELELENQELLNEAHIDSLFSRKIDVEISYLRQEMSRIDSIEKTNNNDTITFPIDDSEICSFKKGENILSTILLNKNYREVLAFIEKYPEVYYGYNIQKVNQQKEKVEELLYSNKLNLIDLENKLAIIQIKDKQIKKWSLISDIGIIIGSVLFFAGLFFWIKNVQIYNDRRAKLECSILESKYNVIKDKKVTKPTFDELSTDSYQDNDTASLNTTDPTHR